jgi:hypothetical protein
MVDNIDNDLGDFEVRYTCFATSIGYCKFEELEMCDIGYMDKLINFSLEEEK